MKWLRYRSAVTEALDGGSRASYELLSAGLGFTVVLMYLMFSTFSAVEPVIPRGVLLEVLLMFDQIVFLTPAHRVFNLLPV